MSSKKRIPKFLQAMRGKVQQRPASTTAQHVQSTQQFNVGKEAKYIQKRAASGDSRVVGLGQLVFFSTQTRDAWMLDWQAGFANCLMKEGVAQPLAFGETAREFAIPWQGRYRIAGESFSYIDNENPKHARVMHGYPTDAISKTIERLKRGV